MTENAPAEGESNAREVPLTWACQECGSYLNVEGSVLRCACPNGGYQQVPPGHHVVPTGVVVLEDGTRWEVASEDYNGPRNLAALASGVGSITVRLRPIGGES